MFSATTLLTFTLAVVSTASSTLAVPLNLAPLNPGPFSTIPVGDDAQPQTQPTALPDDLIPRVLHTARSPKSGAHIVHGIPIVLRSFDLSKETFASRVPIFPANPSLSDKRSPEPEPEPLKFVITGSHVPTTNPAASAPEVHILPTRSEDVLGAALRRSLKALTPAQIFQDTKDESVIEPPTVFRRSVLPSLTPSQLFQAQKNEKVQQVEIPSIPSSLFSRRGPLAPPTSFHPQENVNIPQVELPTSSLFSRGSPFAPLTPAEIFEANNDEKVQPVANPFSNNLFNTRQIQPVKSFAPPKDLTFHRTNLRSQVVRELVVRHLLAERASTLSIPEFSPDTIDFSKINADPLAGCTGRIIC